MDFGRLPEKELDHTNFTLPREPVWNNSILPGKRDPDLQVFLGCAKWGRKEWLGKIYPRGTKEANFLEHYVHHYNSIELNATHYKIYSPEMISKWASRANGMPFRFCPKVPQTISHYSGFKNVDQKTDEFLTGIHAFGEHLGPIFLQVSERYSPAKRQDLFNYLASLPTDLQFFLEVRHPDWFAEKGILQETLEFLKEKDIGFVITDAAARRDCAHMYLTVPKCFVRYVGNSLHPTDYTRIDDWVKRLKKWIDKGIREIYFFMHMHNEAYSPELTVYVVDKLNKACDLELKKPHFINDSLF